MDLVELTLDDKAFLEKFNCTRVLDLSYTGLRNLKNLPVLPSVRQLVLSDNNLNGDDMHLINLAFKYIKVMILCNNLIRNPEHVGLLSKCIHLRTVDMSANPVTES